MSSYYAGLSPREVYERKCGELRCRKNSEICRILSDVPDEFCSLKFIDLSNNFLGPRGILPLLEIIRCSKNIRLLNLREQQLDNDAIVALCLALRKHPSVIEIDLSDNPLTISAGTSLLQLLKTNPVIESMILDRSNIRPSLLLMIQAQLEMNRALKDISSGLNTEEVTSGGGMGLGRHKNAPHVCSGSVQSTESIRNGVGEISNENVSNMMAASNRKQIKMYDVEAALLSISHTLHEVLFDENPVPAIAQLCEQEQALFYDTQFAADDESVHHHATLQYGISGWRRVSDIYPSATLFPDGARGDPVVLPQSCLPSFSWVFTCAGAVLTDLESLQSSVLSSSFGGQEHGVYGLRVHIDGDWRYVVVDDFLPVNSGDELVFAHPVNGKYFWPCILEKAVAKLHGGYSALDLHAAQSSFTGWSRKKKKHVDTILIPPCERNQISPTSVHACHNLRETSCVKILCDLSGGVGVVRFLHHEDFHADEWWVTMLDFYNAGAMIVALSAAENKTLSGIEPCHAYRVVQVQQINGVRLVELCSLWATVRWKGDWSDESVQWSHHAGLELVLRGKHRSNNSVSFWMSYVDFIVAFSYVHICHVFKGFNSRVVEGEWDRKSAGGPCFGHEWHLNPHYRLNVKHDSPLFINLAVPDTRFTPVGVESLGFHILQKKHYPLRYQPNTESVVAATKYVNTDSISFEGIVQGGGEDYWVVPSSHLAGVTGSFILRIFSHSGFVITKEELSYHWNTLTHTETVECSGEYHAGDDNAQVNLHFEQLNNCGSSESKTRAVVAEVRTPDSDDLALGMFLVRSPMVNNRPFRSLGMLSNESVVAVTPFTIGKRVYLEAEVCSGEAYNLVVCVNPVGSRAKLEIIIWTTHQSPKLTPLPVWEKKIASVSWPQGSGSYYEVTKNPQIEIYRLRLHETFVVRMQVTECNYSDPAIVLFLLSNKDRQGEGIKGQIPADRVVARSKYVRHFVVQCEFQVTECMDSMLIVPCLQPPGSFADCTITVATETGDFAIRVLSTG